MKDAQKFADELLSFAKKHGATAADIVIGVGNEVSAAVREGKPENIEQSENSGFGLRVFVGGKSAIISSSKFDEADKLAERAVSMAKQAPVDEYAALADKTLLATEFPDLDIFDASAPSAKKLAEMAQEAEDIALAHKGITNTEGAEAGFGIYTTTLATSDGFYHSMDSSRYSVSVCVLAESESGMERDYDYTSARHFTDLKPLKLIADNAAMRTLARLNPRKIKSGNYPIIFEPRMSNDLVSDLASGINGSGIARGTSFLKNKLGEQIFPENINIIDDPLIKRGAASKPFDAEGVANKKINIIENGVLKTWLLDVRSAGKLGLITNGRASRGAGSPPSPSCTNMYMEAGKLSPQELMADIKEGLFITETSGMGVNYTNGDYSVGASGFFIENGQIAYPVNEITIAGNLLDMFKNLQPANDLLFDYGINAPTIRIDSMTVAGL